MRIAEVATLATPVSSLGSGSIEAIMWHLAKGMAERGHEVTVFGAAGSTPPAGVELVPTLPDTYGAEGVPEDWRLCEWENVARAVAQCDRFDVVHSHSYLLGLPLEPVCPAPMVHTMARRDTVFNRGWKRRLMPRLGIFPISPSRGELDGRAVATVYQLLAKGGVVLIFPEGRYSRGRALRPLKKGVAHFALQAGVPICPVALSGLSPTTTSATSGASCL